jgi:hypothetical protein
MIYSRHYIFLVVGLTLVKEEVARIQELRPDQQQGWAGDQASQKDPMVAP